MYPKGDLRRMLVVLGAIDAGSNTLVQIAAATGLDKKTITALLEQAVEQARVNLKKDGAVYVIEDWGPVLRKEGATKALTGALNAPKWSFLASQKVKTMAEQNLFESCPECGESKRLSSELHPGTSFVICDACGFKGPELLPKADSDGKHRPAAVWEAWNTHAKALKAARAKGSNIPAPSID
ncbi:hypothetical protein P353_08215 [Comamonas testosteroni]|uniref:Uncharacterized protein n=2 Tax=Comamonas testosteroni TaxID=285 RepID=A0A096H056_COMTE|nr:hypothetical protein P353_08215 [Comamonas testosteroni]